MLGPIGNVLGARGLKGELRLRLFRASPTYLAANRVFVGDVEHRVLRLSWLDGWTAVVTLDRVTDRTQAEALIGRELSVDPRWFAPGEGPIELLIGAHAVDADTGASLGLTVTGIETNGAQDLLVLGEVMIPYVEALVPGVDVGPDGKQRVRIRAIEGLIE